MGNELDGADEFSQLSRDERGKDTLEITWQRPGLGGSTHIVGESHSMISGASLIAVFPVHPQSTHRLSSHLHFAFP